MRGSSTASAMAEAVDLLTSSRRGSRRAALAFDRASPRRAHPLVRLMNHVPRSGNLDHEDRSRVRMRPVALRGQARTRGGAQVEGPPLDPVLALKNKEMDAVMIQKYADMEQLEKTGYFYRLKQTGSSRVDWHSCWSGRAGEAILWRHFWDWKRIRGQISCCRTTEIVPGRRDGAANGCF